MARRRRSRRRLVALASGLLLAGCAGPGREVRLTTPSRLEGQTFEVRVTVKSHQVMTVHPPIRIGAQDPRYVFDDALQERLRVTVLASGHGRPLRLRITFEEVRASGGGHRLDRQLVGRTFTLSPTGGGGGPAVTEAGRPVTGKLAHLVLAARRVYQPGTESGIIPKALAHPGRDYTVPDAGSDPRASVAAGPVHYQLRSAHLEVLKVDRRGHALMRIRIAANVDNDPLHGKLHSQADEVFDETTGRYLSVTNTVALDAQGTRQTPVGPTRFESDGSQVTTWVYDYGDAKGRAGKGA